MVSYQYTMLLSIVLNHLCLVSPTSSRALPPKLEVEYSELLIYPGYVPSTCGFCGVCCGYSLTFGEL